MSRVIELGKRKQKRLDILKDKVDQLFDVNINMLKLAEDFLENGKNETALEIIELETITDRMQQEIVLDVNTILITEQPKAGDLRLTLGILTIASELEIIGDYFKQFAKAMLKTELVERKHQKLVTNLIHASINDFTETKLAFDMLSHDLASSIVRRREEIENNTKKFSEDINHKLVEATTLEEVKDLTRTIGISKYIDRTFAHLMVICEQISYIVNGQIFHYA